MRNRQIKSIHLLIVLIVFVLNSRLAAQPQEKFDLVILNGRVIDPETKLDAVKNETAESVSGLPNTLDRVNSLSTKTILSAGPHVNVPANAPAVVRTEGTTVVRSTSETFTPGEI